MQYVNLQGDLKWHGPHQQQLIYVLVLKSQCTSQIVKL
jgi:hypothetical protein